MVEDAEKVVVLEKETDAVDSTYVHNAEFTNNEQFAIEQTIGIAKA